MNGFINFRDVGGVAASAGRRVASDRLYRCGHLADLDEADRAWLADRDFALVVDLRFAGEQKSDPSPWPSDYIDRILCHEQARDGIAPHVRLLLSKDVTVERVLDYYAGAYRDMPFDPAYQPLFGAAVRRLASGQGRTLVHCTAGKDRTGVLVALILDTIGVSRDDIFADYLKSAGDARLMQLAGKLRATVIVDHGIEVSVPALETMLTVHSDYLAAMFESVERRCGSVSDYLSLQGIDDVIRQKLFDALTENDG